MKKSEVELRKLLTMADVAGDYEEADRIRDEIKALKATEKIVKEHHSYVIYQERGLWRSKVKLPNGKFKKFSSKSREELLDKLAEYYQKTFLTPTIKDLYKSWIEMKAKSVTPETITRYNNTYKRAFDGDYLETEKISDVTEETLYDFCERVVLEKKLTRRAFSDVGTLLRGVMKRAKWKGLTKISITQFYDDLDLEKSLFADDPEYEEELQAFSDEEIKALAEYFLAHPDNPIYLGLLLMAETGMRVGEMVALRNSDINLDEGTIRVKSTEVQYDIIGEDGKKHRIFEIRPKTKTKAGKRPIVLSESAIETIKTIRRWNPFGEFLIEKKGKNVKSKSFNYYLKKVCEAVGIPPRSTHKLRKTYASALNEAGVGGKLLQVQMGHASPRSTEPYIRDRMSISAKKIAINGAITY